MANVAQTPELGGTGDGFPIVAPLLGLNTRDDYTALKPQEARILENWLPDGGSCKVRPGYTSHQTIAGAASVAVLSVRKGAVDQQLIAAANGEIWDVTGTPSELSSNANYASDRWSMATYRNYIFGVNGTSTPWRYDGTTFGATGFTGPTLTTLETVSMVRNRLWFTVKNSADVYYAEKGAITGALSLFSLSQIASGGKCVGIGSWSKDAGDGADDFTVFIMNTGEIIVYQGDPGAGSSATAKFRIEGKYSAPAPVGLEAFVKVGGELVVLTSSGPVPVTAAVAGNAFDPIALDKWGKIAGSWAADFKRYGSNIGWNAHFFNGLVYFVIPTGVATSKVYVINTRNGAPTLYTKMPVSMFADIDGELYFGTYGTDGKIWRHATGADDGAEIVTIARQGWSYQGSANRSNQYTMMRVNINSTGSCQAQFQLDVDFKEGELVSPIVEIITSGEGGEWDEADWDDADWASEPSTQRRWYAAVGRGRAVAPVVRTFSTADEVEWFGTDVIAKPGGIL